MQTLSNPIPSVEGGYYILTTEGVVVAEVRQLEAVENKIYKEFDTTTEGWESEWTFQENNPAVD